MISELVSGVLEKYFHVSKRTNTVPPTLSTTSATTTKAPTDEGNCLQDQKLKTSRKCSKSTKSVTHTDSPTSTTFDLDETSSNGISHVDTTTKITEEGRSFTDTFSEFSPSPRRSPRKSKQTVGASSNNTYRIQNIRQVVDAAVFLTNSYLFFDECEEPGIIRSQGSSSSCCNIHLSQSSSSSGSHLVDHSNHPKYDGVMLLNKVLSLAVGSCLKELYPLGRLNLGLLTPHRKVMPPGWKDTILVIGTSGSSLTSVIDFDFRSKFMVARGSAAYRRIVYSLPRIFIGTMQDLRAKVTAISEVAQECLAEQGMPFPPWRIATHILALYEDCLEGKDMSAEKTQSILNEVVTLASQIATPASRQNSPVFVDVEDETSLVIARAAELRVMMQCFHQKLRRQIPELDHLPMLGASVDTHVTRLSDPREEEELFGKVCPSDLSRTEGYRSNLSLALLKKANLH